MTINIHDGGAVLKAGAHLDKASLAAVLLHGRGGSAEEILGLGSAFELSNVAYLAPQAAGHTWYPQSFLAPRETNEPYLSSALGKVESIVGSLEQIGFGSEHIVIIGFSQGACLATEFIASNPARYAGLIAFTGALSGRRVRFALLPASFLGHPHCSVAETPIHMCPGSAWRSRRQS